MKSSKLKNKDNKAKNLSDIKNYKKQRNYVVQLNKNAQLEYFNNFDSSQRSKPFWVKCKPYFSNEHSIADTDIMLNEKGDIIFIIFIIYSTCFIQVTSFLEKRGRPKRICGYSFDAFIKSISLYITRSFNSQIEMLWN